MRHLNIFQAELVPPSCDNTFLVAKECLHFMAAQYIRNISPYSEERIAQIILWFIKRRYVT